MWLFFKPGTENAGKLPLTRYHLKLKKFFSCCWGFIEPNMSLKHNNRAISPPQSIIFDLRPPIGLILNDGIPCPNGPC